MNLAKVKAVVEWLEPKTRKDLQKFLGSADFYRHFIPDFSKVVLPLPKLTSPKQLFQWSPSTQQALERFKHLFSSASVLVQADLNRPFIVEVDTLDSGVGAILMVN